LFYNEAKYCKYLAQQHILLLLTQNVIIPCWKIKVLTWERGGYAGATAFVGFYISDLDNNVGTLESTAAAQSLVEFPLPKIKFY
jgi:hypothetical protein